MNSFESYKENLKVNDKYGVKSIPLSKSVVCSQYALIDTIKCVYGLPPKRHDPPLAAAVVGLNNTAWRRDPFCHKHKAHEHYYWTDIDAQQVILTSKPTCYLILGKHGCGSYTLGEKLAKELNTIHLCPQNILEEELENQSPTGKCLDFNLRHNTVCQPDLVMSIIKQKLESPAIKHRGYVLSGLPLVTASRSPMYLMTQLAGEESISVVEEVMKEVLLNMKKKEKMKTSDLGEALGEMGEGVEEEEEEEEQQPEEEGEEDPAIELPKNLLDPSEHVIFSKRKPHYETKQTILINQMADLFNLEMPPDVIIYITCPDTDIITKRSHKYYDYKNDFYVDQPFAPNFRDEIRWPEIYSMSQNKQFPIETSVFNPKYYCKQPMDFPKKAEEQACNYKKIVLPFIEKKIQDFHEKDVIKLDGRWTVSQMLHNILERKPFMHYIKPIRVPKPLYLEDPPDDLEEFWTMIEDIVVATNGVIKFNRYASPWYNRCPVELKNRRTLRGKPKYAISFYKHVFLMSSLDALIMFWKNPRPFLKFSHLEPTCRVIIIGTKSSGKTMIAECLSWIFKAPVINFKEFEETEKKKKYESFSKNILLEIAGTIEDDRFAKWQNLEEERVRRLEEWQETTISQLKKYINFLGQYDNQKSDAKFIKSFNHIKTALSYLPYLNDVKECKRAVQNRDVLRYAPASLITVTEKPNYPVYGDRDVTEAIANYIENNKLQEDAAPSGEELMAEISKIITRIDETVKADTDSEELYGKYIIDDFTTDPDCWAHLSDLKIMPDHTIALIENRELTPELIVHYMQIEKDPKNHSNRFLLADDPLIKIRLQDGEMPQTNLTSKQSMSMKYDRQSSHPIAGSSIFEHDVDEKQAEMMTELSTAIDKFREDWDSLKLKIEESNKSFIEVELDEKSDVAITEEVLLMLRKSYCAPCEPTENEDLEDQDEEAEPRPKDWLKDCDPRFYCDTGIYCPVAFYDHGVLWEGNSEFFIKYNNRAHYFSKEECIDIFKRDVTKYQTYSLPFKKFPPFRICVMGCVGSGKTTISKLIAKELGLVYVDFAEAVNNFLMPRHFKKVGRQYENSFTDTPIDEEAVVEFQIDEDNENFISDILSNEAELRRMVFNYFERGTPLLSVLLQKLLKKLWFEDPFVRTGFVIDGFPRTPSDVDDMLACFAIPDLILELQSSADATIERLAPGMMKIWKKQQNEAKERARQKFNAVRQEWMHMITKTIVAKLIFYEIVDNVITFTEPPAVILSAGSAIIDAEPTGSLNLDANLFNLYNEMIQEYPEPVDESEWEKADEVRERLDSRLEAIYESDEENIETLKDTLLDQRIRVTSVNANKSLTNVKVVALSKLSLLRSRNASFFEQSFIVSQEDAETLLTEGLCFMSKFYNMCPVYSYENPNSFINPYKLGKQRGDLFPVIHRSYIYFILGEDAVCKFRSDPLKYIASDHILEIREFPLRIGVIGPPKSGKSSLAAKLEKQYGLMALSIGMAVRNILVNMYWTELGGRMIKALKEGKCIDQDLILIALQIACIDWRVVTHGFVFDGIPDSASLVTALSRVGLYPLVIFDLAATKKTVIERSQNKVHNNIIKIMPPYSESYINHRHSVWDEHKDKVRSHINNDCQNLVPIDANVSKWQCFQNANDYIKTITPKIHQFLRYSKSSAVCMGGMCISNEMFEQRMSLYKDMCPLCLRRRVLKYSGFPVDKKGVVQFRNVFYWICSEHMETVLKEPGHHLPGPRAEIPKIPVPVKIVDVHLVYENGICMVTYAENLPSQIIVVGDKKYAANYKGKIYLFCGAKCLEKFMAKPHMYFDIVVFKDTQMLRDIHLNELPNIGYLEQTLGNLLTKACCSVNVLRPKYPGLSIELSGLLYIGLYLKINNPRFNQDYLPLYKKIFEYYEAVSKLIIKTGLLFRSMDNPFANYPKCCASFIGMSDSGTVCKPSTIKSGLVPHSDTHIQFPFARDND